MQLIYLLFNSLIGDRLCCSDPTSAPTSDNSGNCTCDELGLLQGALLGCFGDVRRQVVQRLHEPAWPLPAETGYLRPLVPVGVIGVGLARCQLACVDRNHALAARRYMEVRQGQVVRHDLSRVYEAQILPPGVRDIRGGSHVCHHRWSGALPARRTARSSSERRSPSWPRARSRRPTAVS